MLDFHSTEFDEMRRIELWAAVNVMGAKDGPMLGLGDWPSWEFPDGAIVRKRQWRPLTDANADYEVLRRVREEWERGDCVAWGWAIQELWMPRTNDDDGINPDEWDEITATEINYEIGDYTRAACIVKAQEIEDDD